ncbi:MAG: bifunctional nuclease family protein [Bacteroidia bacterium]|nr:bifunctional nuclease family protein [Bacteroidia bacterium]
MVSKNDLIELELKGLSNSRHQNFYTKLFSKLFTKLYDIILVEKNNSDIGIFITITQSEASALASIMENMDKTLPATHELFKMTNADFDNELKYIVIEKIDNDRIFHCKLIISKSDEISEITSRAIDAISFAVLYKKSIFIDKAVFEDNSVELI